MVQWWAHHLTHCWCGWRPEMSRVLCWYGRPPGIEWVNTWQDALSLRASNSNDVTSMMSSYP
ncbi:MAG: hypothetical protein R3C44_07905 [Chloroflexota bacterium]